jgi:hypothetical protein
MTNFIISKIESLLKLLLDNNYNNDLELEVLSMLDLRDVAKNYKSKKAFFQNLNNTISDFRMYLKTSLISNSKFTNLLAEVIIELEEIQKFPDSHSQIPK